MKRISWIIGFLVCAAGVLADAPPAPARPPFDALEKELRMEAASATETWKRAPASERSAPATVLKSVYESLHDIRHYEAFGELWGRWAFAGDTLEVLYPASGAHLAPLEFVHRGNLREATFTYTEIDPAMIPRLEANLVRLMNLGFYADLSASVTPLPPTPGSKGGAPLPPIDATPDRIRKWIADTIAATGSAPPLEAGFTFRYRETRVRLRLLLNASSTAPGSTEFFRGEDLSKADLVVTHDISFDPREHLAFLRSCIESACAQERKRPLAVMMEDLARHPARLDLFPFGVRAVTRQPYGHAAYVYLPDGTRTEAEDGPPLYEGAVLLEPDLARWAGLSPVERAAIFNLVLLRDHGYDRRNVALADGRRVEAPGILDWHLGYGHRDIEGRDLRGKSGFLADLVRTCLATVGNLPSGPFRGWLCNSLGTFRSRLENIAARNGASAAQEAAAVPPDHPFLTTPETRRKFQLAVSAAAAISLQLQADGKEAAQAAHLMGLGRLRKAGCRMMPSSPDVPTIKKVFP